MNKKNEIIIERFDYNSNTFEPVNNNDTKVISIPPKCIKNNKKSGLSTSSNTLTKKYISSNVLKCSKDIVKLNNSNKYKSTKKTLKKRKAKKSLSKRKNHK